MRYTIILLLLINCAHGYINRVLLNVNYRKYEICKLKMINNIPNTPRRDLLLYGTSIRGVTNV